MAIVGALLELDCGNSRVKWRLRPAGDAPALAGAMRYDALEFPSGIAPGAAVRELRVANVAGEACAATLDAWAWQRWKVTPRYAQVSAAAGGVSNRYDAPSSLGVDRWLACVAAFQRCGRAVCVIDGGTALTVDGVDGDGHFLGGYIAPGMCLLASALSGATRLPAMDIGNGPPRAAPGRNTADARAAGAWGMALGLCQRALDALRQQAGPLAVCATGGHGAILLTQLRCGPDVETEYIPDLVLDGLAWCDFVEAPTPE